MPEVDFLPYATAVDANVEDQTDYAADSTTTEGQQTGLAKSAVFNKIWRQGNFIAAAIANVVSQVLGVDVLDDGNLSGLITKIKNTITSLAWTNPNLTGTATAPTPAATDSSTKIATTAWFATRRYTSPLQNIATDNLYSVAHGLGALPSKAWVELVCTSAYASIFAVGDVVTMFGGARNSDSGVTVGRNTTTVYFKTGNDGITIVINDGTTVELTGSANFQMRIVAEL